MKIDIIGSFEKAYLKLPSLSSGNKDFIVRIIPFFTIIFGTLITIASVMDFLGSAVISSFTLGGQQIIQQLLIRSVLGVVQGVIMIFAFPGLRSHQQKGWRLLFWSQIIWTIAAAISFNPSIILGFIILYPLFQVKNYYK